MKFDAIEYLQAWAGEGRFPAIHDPIYEAIVTKSEGRSYCDLGACTGLLAQRIKTGILFSAVCAVEANPEFTHRGRRFGIDIPTLTMRLTRQSISQFVTFLEAHRVNVLVARRVMPELWGSDLAGGRMLATALAAVGVTEIFLQGRVVTKSATNALASVENEMELFADEYSSSLLQHSVCYLRLK